VAARAAAVPKATSAQVAAGSEQALEGQAAEAEARAKRVNTLNPRAPAPGPRHPAPADYGGVAGGEGAGLVEYSGVDATEDLERVARAHQVPYSAAIAPAAHHGVAAPSAHGQPITSEASAAKTARAIHRAT
jgi:hypothetical protein